MGLNGRKGFAVIGNPLVGNQVNDEAARHQFLGQRLGRKQMSARSACRENHNTAPNSAKHLVHQIPLTLLPVARSLTTGKHGAAAG